AAKAAADGGASPAATLRAAADAAAKGAEDTIPLQATKGRASYLGERSIGHQDPGATSTAYILGAAADAAEAV
ncbi:DAK2 domain-containing protein, partial [Propionicimonas sp.]|uniref:DAK2 domain-containing protein n=1 Tax=Propionicimonas sp. TaxID=1955623 RepID=UPI0039E66A7A